MSKAPAFQFYVKDWLSAPEVRRVSATSRGVWIDLLCFMWLEEEQGRIRWELFEVARATGVDLSDVQKFLVEAQKADLCDVEIHGDVTNGHTEVTLTNRRMHSEWKDRYSNRIRKQKQRASQPCPTKVTPPSSSASSSALSSSPYGLSKEHPSDEGCLSAYPPDGGQADAPAQPKPETRPKAREADVPKRARDDCPHREIVEAYHEILPELPHVRVWDGDNKAQLRSRWNESAERRALAWWREFFQRVKASDFLCGRKAGNGRDPFFACLGWLVKRSNLAKVLNGQFDNRGPRTGSSLGDRNAMVAQQAIERRRLANEGR